MPGGALTHRAPLAWLGATRKELLQLPDCGASSAKGIWAAPLYGLPDPPWCVTLQGHGLIYVLCGPELRVLRDSQHSKAKRSTESTPGAQLSHFFLMDKNHTQNRKVESLCCNFLTQVAMKNQFRVSLIMQPARENQLLSKL